MALCEDYATSNFTEISHEMWDIQAEIHALPSVKYEYH